MTAPGARIVHRLPGRSRLRTRGMKGDDAYFAEVQTALTQTRGVRTVHVNPRTESILVEHDAPIEEIMLEAERRGYLRLDETVEAPYLANINRAILDSDEKLKQASSGKVDLETITFLGFVAGGIYQIFNGHGLPAGVTLLRYAVELVGSAGAAALEKQAQALQRSKVSEGK